ncbi:unnamed protein product [Fraxinus pennsylvanica]|uniref:Uncharacterized protein n=1 Tax=Fraxinus pennsylvanica TaxID=56036 RepID=A0AAD1ZK40_9LAMI|nr:unnamed protein product [Fraxinus pennsylvanica]
MSADNLSVTESQSIIITEKMRITRIRKRVIEPGHMPALESNHQWLSKEPQMVFTVKVQKSETLDDACVYFNWVKDAALSGESDSVSNVVNHAPNEDDEELSRLLDRLARISEKRGIDMQITFSKGKEIAKCGGEGKGSE